MLQKKSLIVIAGWGHPVSVLDDLCLALAPDTRTVPVSSRDLWLKGQAECGGSDAKPLSCYAAGLWALIREQGDALAVAGWSMGGMAALELAVRHPKAIGRLALISSTPKFCSNEDWPCGIPPANVRAMRGGLKRVPDKVLASFYRLAASPHDAPLTKIPDPLADGCDELVAGLDYLLQMDLRSGLERVKAPVLIVHGREDRVVPGQAAEKLHRGLPGSRLCLHDGVGHDLPQREPGKLAQDLRNLFVN